MRLLNWMMLVIMSSMVGVAIALTLCILASLAHAAPSPANLGLDKTSATGTLFVQDRSGAWVAIAPVNSTTHAIAIPNSSLANVATTVGGATCTLGAACSPSTTVGGSACALGGTCAPTLTVNGTTCTLGGSCAPTSAASLVIGTSPTSGGAAGQLMFDTGSVLTESAALLFTSPTLKIVSDTAALSMGAAGDTILLRDGAGFLSQRNGTNKQTHAVYDSYTNGTSYERGVLDWQQTSNVLSIGTQGGSGSAPTLGQFQFIANGVAKADFGVTTTGQWTFDTLVDVPALFSSGAISASGNITTTAAMAVSGALSGGSITSGSTIESNSTITADAGNITARAGSLVAVGVAATVTTGQIAYGGAVQAATSCGSLASSVGCVIINVAGTQHFVPYY